MSFKLHEKFIAAASESSPSDRIPRDSRSPRVDNFTFTFSSIKSKLSALSDRQSVVDCVAAFWQFAIVARDVV